MNNIIIYSNNQDKIDYINNHLEMPYNIYLYIKTTCVDTSYIVRKEERKTKVMTIDEEIGSEYKSFYTSFCDFIDSYEKYDMDVIILVEDFDLAMLVKGLNDILSELSQNIQYNNRESLCYNKKYYNNITICSNDQDKIDIIKRDMKIPENIDIELILGNAFDIAEERKTKVMTINKAIEDIYDVLYLSLCDCFYSSETDIDLVLNLEDFDLFIFLEILYLALYATSKETYIPKDKI